MFLVLDKFAYEKKFKNNLITDNYMLIFTIGLICKNNHDDGFK